MNEKIGIWITAVVFILCGCGMVFWAYTIYKDTKIFLKSSVSTNGIIVDVQRTVEHTYVATAQFESELGHIFRFNSRVKSNPSTYKIGDAVEILYMPENPNQAIIDSVKTKWGGMYLLGGSGVFSMLIGMGAFFLCFSTKIVEKHPN